MWANFNNSFTVTPKRTIEEAEIKHITSSQTCLHTNLWNMNVQMCSYSFMLVRIHTSGRTFRYLNKKLSYRLETGRQQYISSS